jgi:hypothetical protein
MLKYSGYDLLTPVTIINVDPAVNPPDYLCEMMVSLLMYIPDYMHYYEVIKRTKMYMN